MPALAWHVAPCAAQQSWPHPIRNVVRVKSLDLVSGTSEDRAWLRDVEAFVVTLSILRIFHGLAGPHCCTDSLLESGLA